MVRLKGLDYSLVNARTPPVFLSNNMIADWPNFCKRQTGLHNFTPKILIHSSKPVILFCYECLKNCPKKFQMSEQYLDCLDKMSEVNFSPAETLGLRAGLLASACPHRHRARL